MISGIRIPGLVDQAALVGRLMAMTSKDELYLRIERSRERWKSFRLVMGLVGGTAIVYFITQALTAIANTNTSLMVFFQGITDLRMNEWFGLVVGGGGSIWALGERRFRKKEIQRLTAQIDPKNHEVDPRKESSGLTKMGNSQKEHK